MKIETNSNGQIVLKKVFIPIILESDSSSLSICMRHGEFEFTYDVKLYSAKDGSVKCLGCVNPCSMNYCDENGCTSRTKDFVNEVPCKPM